MPNYIKNIEDAKQKAISIFSSRIGDMNAAAYAILLQAIEDTFDTQAGKIVTDKNFIKNLNRLTISVLDLLQSEPKFTGPVSLFVKRLDSISESINTFQKATNGIKVPDFATAKNIAIDEITDQMLNNGLNQHFVQPLRDLIYRNATSGLSLKDAKQNIKEYIAGGKDVSGKLGRYIDQTAEQAVDSYSGIINYKIMQTFDYNGMLITGSLIDNSSPQCRYAINKLNGTITKETWPEVEAIGKTFKGWIDGTNFENVTINKLHHGCRHNFFPIIIKKAA